MEIKPIRVPNNVIREIPAPVTQRPEVARPVIRALEVPIIDVPRPIIKYPTLDVPTRETFEGAVAPPKSETPTPEPPSRDLPSTPPQTPIKTQPAINVGGLDIPIPDPAPLVAAGSLAVVTTVVTLGSTIALTQVKSAAEPLVKKLLTPKKKKIKIKQVKPVLHYIMNEDGTAQVIQYGAKGMKILKDNIDNLEQYLRDQVDIDSLYEFDNKLLIDEDLTKSFTKEGQKRFKRHIVKPKAIAKKLAAKFSF